MKEISFCGIVGKKVLIKGEAQTGKTKLLERLIREAISCQTIPISLIEMAPVHLGRGNLEVGGRVAVKGVRGLRYYVPDEVFAPRLQGRSAGEVLEMAKKNAVRIGEILENYLEAPTPILFINDLTIYLHAGDPETLRRAISSAETFVGTAYAGVAIGGDHGSGINRREKALLAEIEESVDAIMTLAGSRRHPRHQA